MTTQGLVFIKTLLKTSLDNYVLPGTVVGTEIMWLYMVQWTRDLTALTTAAACLMIGQLEIIPRPPKSER